MTLRPFIRLHRRHHRDAWCWSLVAVFFLSFAQPQGDGDLMHTLHVDRWIGNKNGGLTLEDFMAAGNLEWSRNARRQVEHDDVLVGVRSRVRRTVWLMDLKAGSEMKGWLYDRPNGSWLRRRLRQIDGGGRRVDLTWRRWRERRRNLHRLNVVNMMLNVHGARHWRRHA